MAYRKNHIIIDDDSAIDVLLRISPFCAPLMQLLSDFYEILVEEFKERKYITDLGRTAHDRIIAAFTEAENTLLAMPADASPAGQVAEQFSPTNASPAQSKLREEMSPFALNPNSRPITGVPRSQQPSSSTLRTGSSMRGEVPPLPSLMDYQSSTPTTPDAFGDVDSDEEDMRGDAPGSPSPAERKGKGRHGAVNKRLRTGRE